MKVKIPPQGENLLKKYKRYSGKPANILLVECLEAFVKKDKRFQEWLKDESNKQEPTATKPASKPIMVDTPAKRVQAIPEPELPHESAPVARKPMANSLENELR